ncbi:DUF354 domain-containing protein [bacterium]|nr:DUF354 domain-containing protein [bacterium]
MRVLFFIVHPAKFWLFRYVTLGLRKLGHTVDWAIVDKDVLVELLEREGWEYTNIFPEGRRSKKLPKVVSLFVYTWKTLVRCFKLLKGKKYDLVISGDIITFVAWLKGIKSVVPIDDGFDIVPEYSVSWAFANKLVSPQGTDLGPFNYKRLAYTSNHEWAYLNPKYFKPNSKIVKKFNPTLERYFIIRLVSLTASHDGGKRGLSDEQVDSLIELLSQHGKVFINAEKGRDLRDSLKQYLINVSPYDMHHAMYYSDLFIGDSQTMASEGGLMGVPTFRCNDFVGKVPYLQEEEDYGLIFNYKPEEFESMYQKIKQVLKMKDAKKVWKERVEAFAKYHIDTTQFYIDLIQKYDKKGQSKK